MSVEQRLQELGYQLPPVVAPVAAYIPGLQVDRLIFTSGQIPMAAGQLIHKGRLGDGVTVEEGYAAARLCALNALAVLKDLVGDLDRIERIVKVVGFVNSADSFTQQPAVINGASELLGTIFGAAGQHARSAVGVNSLPLGAAVELEIIALLREQ